MSHVHFQAGTSPSSESILESLPTGPSWLFTQGLRYSPDFHVNSLHGYPTHPVPLFSPRESQYPYDRSLLPHTVHHDTNDNLTTSGTGINPNYVSSYNPHPSVAPLNNLAPPFSPTLPSDGPRTRDNRYEHLINRIEEQQEALRDVRDNLVGSRFILQSKRQELRATRMKAATEAGTAFSLIKRYFLQEAFSLPADIEAALSVADNSRDALGMQESEYEEAEERYNQEEWGYNEKETAFIEGLSSNTPVPLPASGHVHFDPDITRLSHVLDESLNASNVHIHHMDSEPQPPTVSAIPPINLINDEASLQMPTMFRPMTPPGPSLMLTSPDATLFQNMGQPLRLLSHRDSDSELSSAPLLWSDTCKRIEVWLLDTVRCSKLEQYRLRSASRSDLMDQDWWQLVAQTWSSESPDHSIFRTGDTTVSITTVSEVPGGKPDHRQSSVSNTSNSDIEGLSKIPPLLEDHFIDRDADPREGCKVPPTFEPHELDDLLSETLAFLEPPQSVLSTAPTIMTPNFFSIDDDSANEEGVHSSCTSSENGEIVCRDNVSDGTKSTTERDDDGLDAISSFINKQGDIIEQQRPITGSLLLSRTRPFSPESEHGNMKSILHRANGTENRYADCFLTLPPSPPNTRSCSPGSDRRSLCPFAPLVRFKNLTPWCFPLLRLKSFSEHPRLGYFPFVFLSGSSFRLPDPVKVSETQPEDHCD